MPGWFQISHSVLPSLALVIFSLHAIQYRVSFVKCVMWQMHTVYACKRVRGMFTPDLEHKRYSYVLFSNIVDAAACAKIVWWY